MRLRRSSIRARRALIETNFTNVIDSIKDAIDPQQFYRVELGASFRCHSAWVDGGLCPFHEDTNRGSFKVNLITGAFKCFACGTGGGDIIDFTKEAYNLSLSQALEQLKDEWGCYE